MEVLPETIIPPARHGGQASTTLLPPEAVAAREEGGSADLLRDRDDSIRVVDVLQSAEQVFDPVLSARRMHVHLPSSADSQQQQQGQQQEEPAAEARNQPDDGTGQPLPRHG